MLFNNVIKLKLLSLKKKLKSMESDSVFKIPSNHRKSKENWALEITIPEINSNSKNYRT